MDQIFDALARAIEQDAKEVLIPTIAITGGLFIAFVAMVCGTIKSVVSRKATELSRREVAAYVAEGAMTPEQGERLLAAAPPASKGRCCG